ncbi:MAG: ABC transporter [Candidatus Binatia bacterium]|nr:MAG: ABC transporter [Candidatus Binatia bacterium]
MARPVRLELAGVRKAFGEVLALDDVRFEVRAGEVHALLGENGAGKTTLMRCVYGLERPDAGKMVFEGREGWPRNPREARALGISMVHQHFTLVERLTVAENLVLALPGKGLRYDARSAARLASGVAARFGLEIGEPGERVENLSVGTKQRIEIVKALLGSPGLLVLDEPTAVLTPDEVEQLFRVLGRLRSEGVAIVFITHKLREVSAIADRVTVLRRGRIVAERETGETSEDELAALMVGEDVPRARKSRPPEETDVLRARGLRLSPSGEAFDLRVRRGEVLGIAGVDGNGQRELFSVLAGLAPPLAGELFVRGVPVRSFSPASLQRLGIAVVPPERRTEGLVLGMSVAENLVLHRVLLERFARWGWLRLRAVDEFAREEVRRFRIQVSSVRERVSVLSGGNQQRLVVARALATDPEVLVAVNPTRGLDVAATQSVHRLLVEHAEAGHGVLLVSTDLDEVLALSDRVSVLYRHALRGNLERPFEAREVGRLMAGLS